MIDEPNWRPLEVGGLYRYFVVDGFYFTVLANRGNDNYRVFDHSEGTEEEVNFTGMFVHVYDI